MLKQALLLSYDWTKTSKRNTKLWKEERKVEMKKKEKKNTVNTNHFHLFLLSILSKDFPITIGGKFGRRFAFASNQNRWFNQIIPYI